VLDRRGRGEKRMRRLKRREGGGWREGEDDFREEGDEVEIKRKVRRN